MLSDTPNVLLRELSPVYTFGQFRLDPVRSTLTRDSEIVPLPRRVAQLLLILVQANGTVVDRETIAARIWPEGGQTEANLVQHVYMLRQVLGEYASARSLIITVRGRGYRFAAPVTILMPTAELEKETQQHRAGAALLRSGIGPFQQYALGCRLFEQQSAPALSAAIAKFNSVLRVDPNYVPALVELSRAYTELAELGYLPASFAFPRAKQAVMRALELDSTYAPVHALLSRIWLLADWNWRGARQEIRVALDLDRNSIFARTTAARLHLYQGSFEEARKELQHALAIYPSSIILQLLFAQIFLYEGDYTRAIDTLTTLLDAGPDFGSARRYRAQAFILNGQSPLAISDLELLSQDRSENIAFRLPMLARAYSECGDIERATRLYESLVDMSHTECVLQWNLAIAAVSVGRYNEALSHLETSMDRREPSFLLIGSMPWFEPVARRARFMDLYNHVTNHNNAERERLLYAAWAEPDTAAPLRFDDIVRSA